MLILDEPTSGVDPLARDRFWELLIDLSRNQGVTIFVSTHFMNEAERCDRISLMDSGRVLATDTPASLIAARGAATLEDAFISYLEEAAAGATAAASADSASRRRADASGLGDRRATNAARGSVCGGCSPTRSARRWSCCAIRSGWASRLFGTALLMLVFGFGISTDVNNLSFAVLDHDQTPESRAYLEELRGSPYFVEKPPLADYADLEKRLRERRHRAPASKSRPASAATSSAGGRPGSAPGSTARCRSVAQTIRGYLQGDAPALSGRPGGEDDACRRRRRPPISRSGSSTIRISTASMRWCLRPCRCCSRCSRRS